MRDNNDVMLHGVFSRKLIVAFMLFLFSCFVISPLVPPFQSPDEFDHVKRAYLFSKGKILLDAPNGDVSGGQIDNGLLSYMALYGALPTRYDRKITKKEIVAASEIKWEGKSSFSPAPGTGYYFPLAYLPQALGLFIGENLDLPISSSYQLARFFVFFFSGILFVVAFRLFPPNAFVLGILIVPMSIFQLLSAGLDAFTMALTVLCVSLFMRGTIQKLEFTAWMSHTLAVSILVLATSRVHLLPLVILPLVIFYVRRNRGALWQFVLLSIISLTWIAIAATTTFDNRVVSSFSSGSVFTNYLQNPLVLVRIFYSTFTDVNLIGFYAKSFVGILGWIDTFFSNLFYYCSFAILVALAVLSISLKNLKSDFLPRIVLLGISICAVFLIFFALLITWTPFPATAIVGVQGRYLLTPSIIFGYALSGCSNPWEGVRNKVGLCLLLAFAGMVAIAMPRTLIDRYFLFPEQIVVPDDSSGR